MVAVDKAEGGQGMVGALEGGHSCGAPGHALRPDEEASSAAEQLVVELFPKALAEQVESKRVDTRVSECQDPSTDAGDEMQHGESKCSAQRLKEPEKPREEILYLEKHRGSGEVDHSFERAGTARRRQTEVVNSTAQHQQTRAGAVHLIQTSFKYLQGWRLNHFPGQSVPMLDNPLGEEKFPNIQSKPPLAQLEAISSCPITCYLGEETDPHLSTTSFQVVVESDKVSPQPPFLQAKQPQFPQPLLIRLLLQTLHQLRCPSLDTLQHLHVPLVVWGPKPNTAFEVWPHQCRVQGHDHFPSPAGHAIFDTSQDAVGFLGRLGTLPAHIQAAVNQHPQVLFCWAAFQPLFPKPVALHGAAVAQSVPMLDNPLGEEKFPNIQSKPPLAQLEAISSCPITCYLGEETDPHLSTTSFQGVVESDEVSPQPPFLQAKQPQLPQPLLRRLLLQTLHQLRCPSLDTLQHLNIPLVVGGPKLNTVFEVRPHQGRVQGHNHFPSPAGHAIFDTSQDAIGILGGHT
ncbi:hypothetical protein QYF61_027761 [Mycteria americana]|uniref:Uncharacterized protein n=1 Tax=Mycteria americana TaxID=33587 RepID=A0AAN7PN59_MYCAM|nr:hypothetical protein QYF61_027761 [Mycteria americana]